MQRKLTKAGPSHVLVFDPALMGVAQLSGGDELNLEVRPGGSIVITPLRKEPFKDEISEVIKKLLKDYQGTLQVPGVP